MSPTIPSRLAVRCLRQRSYHREERVLGRLATLARTSLLLPRHRKLMKDNILGMLAPPLFTQERDRQVQPHREFIIPTEKNLCQVYHTFYPVQGNLWRCTHIRGSQFEIQKGHRSFIPRERENGFSPNIGEVRDLHEVRADYAISEKVETFRGTSAVGLRTFEK